MYLFFFWCCYLLRSLSLLMQSGMVELTLGGQSIQLLYNDLLFSSFPQTCCHWGEWRAVLISLSPFLAHHHHTGSHCSMTPSQFMASIFQGMVAACFRIGQESVEDITQWWRACLANVFKALSLVPSNNTHTHTRARACLPLVSLAFQSWNESRFLPRVSKHFIPFLYCLHLWLHSHFCLKRTPFTFKLQIYVTEHPLFTLWWVPMLHRWRTWMTPAPTQHAG